MAGQELNEWTLKNFARVDFYANEFDRAIYQKGANALWEKASLCSCLDKSTRQPDFTCLACRGKGYLYFDPQKIRAVVSSISGDKNQSPIGILDVGTTLMTTASGDHVGFRDRLTFVDFETPYSQVLEYDSSGTKLKYACVELVAAHVVGKRVPDDKITLSDDKRILTIDESFGLTDGEQFSVLYRIQPTYIVIDIPHELRGSFVKFGNPDEEWKVLPRQFMIKREDLLPLSRGELI